MKQEIGIKSTVIIVFFGCLLAGCSTTATTRYWGRVSPPNDNILRYVTGSEPESLDPTFGGQPESRILIGLYDRLVEFDPKTMEPIPSVATHWEVDDTGTIYTFHLRKNARFSNGDPITAGDFAWSIRRLVDPATASRYGYFGYEIKNGEAFNSGGSFVRKAGRFLTADGESVNKCSFDGPVCLTVPSDGSSRAEAVKEEPGLAQALEGAELVPVKAEDVGVEAADDFTFRIHLQRPAPYFVSLLAAQYFSVLNRKSIEKNGKEWMKPENLVASGCFKVAVWKPYDELVLVRNPFYWDAENVHLDGVRFFPLDEANTIMNLYKSGRVDATYNHTVPTAWNEYIRQFKDEYMLHPEMSNEFYALSVHKPPMDKLEVRKAFSLAIDRRSLAKFTKTTRPLAYFIPEGVFREYDKVRESVFARLAKRDGVSEEEMRARYFDPAGACKLLAKAGYKVDSAPGGKCKVTDFPASEISITYNTREFNKQIAEFVQAQWKQNLGIEVQIRNMEWKTYLEYRSKVQYRGVVRAGWVGDYIDPFAYSIFFYKKKNDSGTGYWSQDYDRILEQANGMRDPDKRLERLAEAEYFVLKDQPVIPLLTQQTNWMKKPYVKGMYPNPGTLHPWKFVYIEKDPAKWDHDVDNIFKNQSDRTVDAQIAELMKTQLEFERTKIKPAPEAGPGN